MLGLGESVVTVQLTVKLASVMCWQLLLHDAVNTGVRVPLVLSILECAAGAVNTGVCAGAVNTEVCHCAINIGVCSSCCQYWSVPLVLSILKYVLVPTILK